EEVRHTLFCEGGVMLIENEVNKLLRELSYTEQAQVHLNGFAVSVHMLEHGSRLALKTPVYYGGNYIPNSVRESLDKRVPFDRLDIPTCLEIDEDDFSVWLTYKG